MVISTSIILKLPILVTHYTTTINEHFYHGKGSVSQCHCIPQHLIIGHCKTFCHFKNMEESFT